MSGHEIEIWFFWSIYGKIDPPIADDLPVVDDCAFQARILEDAGCMGGFHEIDAVLHALYEIMQWV